MWASLVTLSLSLCLNSIAPALSSPIDILDQLTARALNASDADLLKAPSRLTARPRAPYTFQISPEPLYLKVTRYGNLIDTDQGNRFLTNFLRRFNIFIHDQGRETEVVNLSPLTFANVALQLRSRGDEICAIQAGDLQTWIMGMKTFMALYGWVEVDMQILGIPPARHDEDDPLCSTATLRLGDQSDCDVQEQ
ncbi:MAG: hypothetical protein Q9188_004217 [Gyalolechia gomerana]